jgi:hypothetical protein
MNDPVKLNISRPKTLPQNKLQADRLARPEMFALVSNDTTFEDVMTPAYWANHWAAFQRHPYGEVTVIREDGTMIVKMIAMLSAPGMVKMHAYYASENNSNLLAGEKAPVDDKLELPDGYKAANIAQGEKKGWLVRLPSGEILVEKKATRREAVLAAIAHASLANSPSFSTTTPPAAGAPSTT